ncbi:MAG: nitroreductase family protein [Paludibacteraceae bacterium]|nr:nitroreductase family protein [Paludibacteraceae bacterium]
MDFLKLSESRYSVRGYQSRPVPDELLDKVLASARLAPSAVNKQPWKFVVVRSEEAKNRLRACYDREWFATAPVYIVVCGDHSASWKRPSDGKDHCDIDVAIATEHITLSAASLGLGTCWVCNFDAVACKTMLGLPEEWEPCVIIPIGFPATEAIPSKNRKDLSEIVSYI